MRAPWLVALALLLCLGLAAAVRAQSPGQSDLYASATGAGAAGSIPAVTVVTGTTGYTVVPKYLEVTSTAGGCVTFSGSPSGHTLLVAPVASSTRMVFDERFCNGAFGIVGTGTGALAKGDSLVATPSDTGTCSVSLRYELR